MTAVAAPTIQVCARACVAIRITRELFAPPRFISSEWSSHDAYYNDTCADDLARRTTEQCFVDQTSRILGWRVGLFTVAKFHDQRITITAFEGSTLHSPSSPLRRGHPAVLRDSENLKKHAPLQYDGTSSRCCLTLLGCVAIMGTAGTPTPWCSAVKAGGVQSEAGPANIARNLFSVLRT